MVAEAGGQALQGPELCLLLPPPLYLCGSLLEGAGADGDAEGYPQEVGIIELYSGGFLTVIKKYL